MSLNNTIWQISMESGGYSGANDYRLESCEQKILNCERDYDKWYKIRKRFFYNRIDAEDYLRPIAKMAYDYMVSDWESNLDDDEKPDSQLEETKKRGFQEFRREELTEDSPYYELYHSTYPSTYFGCPSEYEDDRVGQYFGSVSKVIIY